MAAARVAVYLEIPYRRDTDGYSADRAFLLFLLALERHVGRLELIGRVDPRPGRAPYAIPGSVVVHPLPHYPSVKDVGALVRALPRTLVALWRALRDVDVVVAIGPHPSSIPAAL